MTIIKLAPSPRDRSFRSQSTSVTSPRNISSPRSMMSSSPRNNNNNKGSNNYKRQMSMSNNEESSPEFSTNVFNSTKTGKKKKDSMLLSVSPRLAATSNAVAVSSSGGSHQRGRVGVVTAQATSPAKEVTTNAQHYYGKGNNNNNKGGSPASTSKGSSQANNKPSSPSSPNSKPSPNTSFNTHNATTTTANNNNPSPPIDKSANSRTTTTTRSKRMLVVDPKSGQKYNLQEDDHSLTDKELHVYHKKKNRRNIKKALQQREQQQQEGSRKKGQATTTSGTSSARSRSNSLQYSISTTESSQQQSSQPTSIEEQTLNTYSTINDPNYRNEFGKYYNDEEHTLETASALTEVSYYGRYKFGKGSPFECIIPSSCNSLEHLVATAEAGGKEKVEGRDDIESIERGRMKQLLLVNHNDSKSPPSGNNNNKKKGLKIGTTTGDYNAGATQKEGMLSPISHALQTFLSSPRDNLSSFFPFNTVNTNRGLLSPEGSIREIKFRRLCLVVFPNEVQTSLGNTSNTSSGNNNKSSSRQSVGLLGMKFVQNHHDFQAHVSYVQRGSKADRMGVRKGDIVSFAVALSNMTEEENSFLAEKLIKRLESVGMRTSYRELYDIFLSKTTNCRPIGLVFRRWKNRGASGSSSNALMNNNNISPTTPMMMMKSITDEFEWSTDFLQGLSIKCREYEFEMKVPLKELGTHDDDSDNYSNNKNNNNNCSKLDTFLPRPNVNTTPDNGLIANYMSGLFDNLSLLYSQCGDGDALAATRQQQKQKEQAKGSSTNTNDFLSNRTLCSLVEQSMGLIFLRRVATTSSDKNNSSSSTLGSGFALVRKSEGSWSAPCFLSILSSKDKFTDPSSTNETTTKSSDDVKMIVIRKKELVNNLILGNAVKLSVRKEERANVLVRDAAFIGLQDGRFLLTSDFFLAVKVNDMQNQGAYSLSTDHIEASDILTGTISPPDQSVDFYGALQSLEIPYSMHSHPVIPDILQRYSDSDWVEFLPDHESTASASCGMHTKLQMISKRNSSFEDQHEIDIFARKFKYYLMDGVPLHRVLMNKTGLIEEKVLRLTIKDPESLFSSSLELTRKRRPGVSNVGIPSNFSTTFENITKLSRTPPPQALLNLDEEERKRFFSVETDLSPGPVMMLAKSKKDAMILSVGLKLLLEQEKMLAY